MNNRRALGADFEALAAYELEKAGYVILEKNYYTRFGEIDLVARDGEYLVFAEVKFRSGSGFGAPVEAVNFRKQQSMIRSAECWLHKHGGDRGSTRCRFDVISITGDRKIEIVKDAFWIS